MSTRNMQKRQIDAIQCRFCLSEKSESNNPFLTPCQCKGSIEHVHLNCLSRWRNRDIDRNYTVCNLCHSNYILPPEFSLEKLPKRSIYLLILDYPVLGNILFHYVWFVLQSIISSSKADFEKSYLYLQICFQVYYCLTVLFHFQVTKRRRYLQSWGHEGRNLFFPLYGTVVSVVMFSRERDQPFLWFIPNMLMTMFWHIHIHILHQMNHEDIQASGTNE